MIVRKGGRLVFSVNGQANSGVCVIHVDTWTELWKYDMLTAATPHVLCLASTIFKSCWAPKTKTFGNSVGPVLRTPALYFILGGLINHSSISRMHSDAKQLYLIVGSCKEIPGLNFLTSLFKIFSATVQSPVHTSVRMTSVNEWSCDMRFQVWLWARISSDTKLKLTMY